MSINDSLCEFAAKILEAAALSRSGVDLDTVQSLGIACGILEYAVQPEPCCEDCICKTDGKKFPCVCVVFTDEAQEAVHFYEDMSAMREQRELDAEHKLQ